MIQVKLEPGLHKDKDKKKPHIKKPLNAFMLYMKVRILLSQSKSKFNLVLHRSNFLLGGQSNS